MNIHICTWTVMCMGNLRVSVLPLIRAVYGVGDDPSFILYHLHCTWPLFESLQYLSLRNCSATALCQAYAEGLRIIMDNCYGRDGSAHYSVASKGGRRANEREREIWRDTVLLTQQQEFHSFRIWLVIRLSYKCKRSNVPEFPVSQQLLEYLLLLLKFFFGTALLFVPLKQHPSVHYIYCLYVMDRVTGKLEPTPDDFGRELTHTN